MSEGNEVLKFCLEKTIYKYEEVIYAFEHFSPAEAHDLHLQICQFCKHYACRKRDLESPFNKKPFCPLVTAGICGMSGEDLWSRARLASREKSLRLYNEILEKLQKMLEDMK
nr:MAG: hypothetical protein [Lokiarchaeota virus Ratatoskr Meg22_1012]